MFAACLPQPHPEVVAALARRALSAAVSDGLMARSWVAHCQDYYAPRCGDSPAPLKSEESPQLPAALVEQANAVCLILGVEPFPVPVRQVRKQERPTIGIGADALARMPLHKRARFHGMPTSDAGRLAAQICRARGAGRKLPAPTPEQLAHILESPLSAEKVAGTLGLTRNQVYQVRRAA